MSRLRPNLSFIFIFVSFSIFFSSPPTGPCVHSALPTTGANSSQVRGRCRSDRRCGLPPPTPVRSDRGAVSRPAGALSSVRLFPSVTTRGSTPWRTSQRWAPRWKQGLHSYALTSGAHGYTGRVGLAEFSSSSSVTFKGHQRRTKCKSVASQAFILVHHYGSKVRVLTAKKEKDTSGPLAIKGNLLII